MNCARSIQVSGVSQSIARSGLDIANSRPFPAEPARHRPREQHWSSWIFRGPYEIERWPSGAKLRPVAATKWRFRRTAGLSGGDSVEVGHSTENRPGSGPRGGGYFRDALKNPHPPAGRRCSEFRPSARSKRRRRRTLGGWGATPPLRRGAGRAVGPRLSAIFRYVAKILRNWQQIRERGAKSRPFAPSLPRLR